MTRIVRRGVSLTERDLQIIESIRERCGFVSDSEVIRAALRFYAEHAQCLKT